MDFPSPSVFINMDYLFQRLPKPDLSYFSWILQYIWKNRKYKIFKNKTGDPPDILRKAQIEGALWTEAQIKKPLIRVFLELHRNQILNGTNWCYIDGACKEQYIFTGQRRFYRKKESTDTTMEAMNIRRSL